MKNGLTISILGCGWLGLPLGTFLYEKGYSIKGSTRDKQKISSIKESNIEPYLLILEPDIICERKLDFFTTDVLIINIPPPRREDVVEYHFLQIKSLIKESINAGVKKILFVSSTSVYPETNEVVYESETLAPNKPSGIALRQVENMLLDTSEFQTTILRLAGLIGYDRNPRNFLKKRRIIHKIDAPVNLVHRDDCINVIHQIIRNNLWGEIYNVCCDKHPTRADFYKNEAETVNIEELKIKFEKPVNYKIVSNEKLKKELDYEFIYPDPLKLN